MPKKLENLEELKKGPWPSHVRELEKTTYEMEIYEEALKNRQTQWTSGGYMSAPGVPSGIIGRKSKRPEILKESSVIRIMPPPGHFFTTDLFRKLMKIAEEYGTGLLHLFATTSDLELIGIMEKDLPAAVRAIEGIGLDVGSTDATLRSAKACIGPARCDMALIDSVGMRSAFTERFLDDMQYPRFPHKIKTKIAGCPNDCVLGIHKGDIFICGTFKDLPRVDQEKLRKWVEDGGDIEHIVSRCPTAAMLWSENGLVISDQCNRCMYCINKVPAIRPGNERGASILIGGKFRSKYGPNLARVMVPFMKVEPPFTEIFDLIEKITEIYDENARSKERMAEFLYRYGFERFMKEIGISPGVMNIQSPRENLFIKWKKEEL